MCNYLLKIRFESNIINKVRVRSASRRSKHRGVNLRCLPRLALKCDALMLDLYLVSVHSDVVVLILNRG